MYVRACVNKIFFIVNGQNSTRKLSFALTVNEEYQSRVLFLFFINVDYCEINICIYINYWTVNLVNV